MKRTISDEDSHNKKVKLNSSLVELNVGGSHMTVPSHYFTTREDKCTILNNFINNNVYYVECFNSKLFKIILDWLGDGRLDSLCELSLIEKKELLMLCEKFNLINLKEHVENKLKYFTFNEQYNYFMEHFSKDSISKVGLDFSSLGILNFSLNKKDVRSANFTNVKINSNIDGCNLSKSDFTGATIFTRSVENVNFDESLMNNTTLKDSTFVNCSMRKIDLVTVKDEISDLHFKKTDFTGSHLSNLNGCTFENCNFSDCIFKSGIVFTECIFDDNAMDNVEFEGIATFYNCNFKSIRVNEGFQKVQFNNCSFINVDFSEMKKTNLNFANQITPIENCNFSKVEFSEDITESSFVKCNFTSAILSSCIRGDSIVSFVKCNFTSAILSSCIKGDSKVSFVDCDFSGAHFNRCIIDKDCTFKGCSFKNSLFNYTEVKLSTISDLITPFQYHLLRNAIENISPSAMIYKGTKDGFNSSNFHNLCDNKGKTLCLVKTDTDEIMGGITNCSWSCPEFTTHPKDSECTFFRFSNGKLELSKLDYIRNQKNFMCCFGDMLTIVSGCDQVKSSTFKQSGSPSTQFLVKEIEVYQMLVELVTTIVHLEGKKEDGKISEFSSFEDFFFGGM